MGGTMTGRALLKAKQLFPMAIGAGKRLQVIVLVTDGRASNRYWAYQAAKAVRDSGIRLILVPVKGAMRNQADMCAWASKPCLENMIMTPKWPMLISKLKLYMTTMWSVLDFLHLGSSLSLRSFARAGSSVSVQYVARLCSSISVRGLSRFGSVFSMSVLDFLHLGSSLSLRSFARAGSAVSV